MINDYRIWYLAYQCLVWSPNLQSEQNINRQLMEIGADDAEPTHITWGGGGNDPNVMCHVYMTSYENHTILSQPPKCHVSRLTTSYDNHTILDRPPKCHI